MSEPIDQDVIVSMVTIDKFGNMAEHPDYAEWPTEWTAPDPVLTRDVGAGREERDESTQDTRNPIARMHDWIVRTLTKA